MQLITIKRVADGYSVEQEGVFSAEMPTFVEAASLAQASARAIHAAGGRAGVNYERLSGERAVLDLF